MNEPTPLKQTSKDRAQHASDAVKNGLKRRYAAEARFKAYGIGAIALALTLSAFCSPPLLAMVCRRLRKRLLNSRLNCSEDVIDPSRTRDPGTLARANYRKVVFDALLAEFPDVKSRADKRKLRSMLSRGASFQVQKLVVEDPGLIGQRINLVVPVSSDFDLYEKGVINKDVAECRSTSYQTNKMVWHDTLKERGMITTSFNTTFFTSADSREPEFSRYLGRCGSGTFFTMIVTLIAVVPDRRGGRGVPRRVRAQEPA